MRTEKEIFDLALNIALKDERIRAVTLEGSRTNPNAPKDMFQDYDISYFVTEMNSFIVDENWIDIYGERIIMQKPEAMSLYPPCLGNWFSYLMLFADGNRIDLTLIPIDEIDLYCKKSDGLIRLLLDKDGRFPALPESSDRAYHIKQPSKEYFEDCCNEFWWVSTYVAKGLWRKEILYASQHLNEQVKQCLLGMMEWKVGIATDFSLSVGKQYKYLSKYVDREEWELLLQTYRNDSYDNCWASLFLMIELFISASKYVAQALAYPYPTEMDTKVTAYLEQVRNLPYHR